MLFSLTQCNNPPPDKLCSNADTRGKIISALMNNDAYLNEVSAGYVQHEWNEDGTKEVRTSAASTAIRLTHLKLKSNKMKKDYELEGMNCGGCVKNVKHALLQLPDVEEAEVQLNPQRAVLIMNKPVDVKELQAQLNKAGHYTIKEVVSI